LTDKLYSKLVMLLRRLFRVRKVERILNTELPKYQSAFLWGPRKTGKTTYLKTHFPQLVAAKNNKNYGKERALKKANRYCKGEYVIWIDADLDIYPLGGRDALR